MTWNQRSIDLEDIPAIIQQGMQLAKDGNPIVEQIRCVYVLEDSEIIYMIPLLDFLDNVPENISRFYLCQMAS